MELELKIGEGESDASAYGGEYGGEKPQPNMSIAHVCIGETHLKKLPNLRPGMKVTVTMRGTVHEITRTGQDSGGAPVGELCLYATEFTSSRGSEFEDLLEGNE